MSKVHLSLIAALLASSAAAQTLQPRQLADGLFASIDGNGDGTITLKEAQTYNQDVMVSMDGNGDGTATRAEFLAWGVGFSAAAEMRMRGEQFQLVNNIMFELMDTSGDGALTVDEMDAFQASAFSAADSDGDSALTADEFFDRHFLNIAARVALG